MKVTRRAMLAGAAAACALPKLACKRSTRFADNPFALGVASGAPSATSVVLWTRLAPEPLFGAGVSNDRVEVAYELADDEGFQKIVQKGTASADPENAHSVHAELAGLTPDRWYWYRFFAGRDVSAVGRTRTLPAPDADPSRLRFAFASCQNWEHGYYAAHRNLAAEDIDFVVFLGDYIYESAPSENALRKHVGGTAKTLSDYRERYTQYRSDPDLQALHAHVPWFSIWDDHEVANDYANLVSEDLDPQFAARRTAAYRAFWEHLPMRADQKSRIYDRVRFGSLAELSLLDARQYKSPTACPRAGAGGSNVVENCAELDGEERSMLGGEQERWLYDGFSKTSAAWNIVAQQTLMAQMDRKPGPGKVVWTDGWDGYPAARRRLLQAIAEKKVANPVVIGGDVHAYFVADLKLDFDSESAPVIASELVCTSMTSRSAPQSELDGRRAENPHLKLIRDKRGYVVLELSKQHAIASLRAIDDPTKKTASISTLAQFAIEAGRPGAVAT